MCISPSVCNNVKVITKLTLAANNSSCCIVYSPKLVEANSQENHQSVENTRTENCFSFYHKKINCMSIDAGVKKNNDPSRIMIGGHFRRKIMTHQLFILKKKDPGIIYLHVKLEEKLPSPPVEKEYMYVRSP